MAGVAAIILLNVGQLIAAEVAPSVLWPVQLVLVAVALGAGWLVGRLRIDTKYLLLAAGGAAAGMVPVVHALAPLPSRANGLTAAALLGLFGHVVLVVGVPLLAYGGSVVVYRMTRGGESEGVAAPVLFLGSLLAGAVMYALWLLAVLMALSVDSPSVRLGCLAFAIGHYFLARQVLAWVEIVSARNDSEPPSHELMQAVSCVEELTNAKFKDVIVPSASAGLQCRVLYSWNSGTLVVSSGIIQALSPGELKAILAHEIAHVALRHGWRSARDFLVINLIGVLGAVVAGIIIYILSGGVLEGWMSGALAVVAIVVPRYLLHLRSTRAFEAEADIFGARATSPHDLVAALEAVRSLFGSESTDGPLRWTSHGTWEARRARILAAGDSA